MANYGRSKEDVQADSIANALVDALQQLEEFNGDPEHVLESARVVAHSKSQGVREAITALCHYYKAEC